MAWFFFFVPRVLAQAGGLLHGKKMWPPSVLRFLIKNNYELAFAIHLHVFLVHSVSFVFTEDTQEITFLFLNFEEKWNTEMYGKTDANNFEIARACLFREFKSSKRTRGLNQWAQLVWSSISCHLFQFCDLCWGSVFCRSYPPHWKQDYECTVHLFAFSCCWFLLHLY